MKRQLHDKVVVITGAASGIGEALAWQCAREGARLLLADVDAPRLAVVADSIRQAGTACVYQLCDVAQPQELDALAARALKEYGGADVLINNAGVALVDAVAQLSLENAHWLMNINFWGVVHGCRSFASQLQLRPDSVIVNVSSLFGLISIPTQSIYNASKAAVRAFSDSLREELRQRKHPSQPGQYTVGVLCVHPGGIRTRLVEQARLGDISMLASSPKALHANFKRIAMTSPEQAADIILQAVKQRRNRVMVGLDARMGDWLYRCFPGSASAWFSGLTNLGMRKLQQRVKRA